MCSVAVKGSRKASSRGNPPRSRPGGTSASSSNSANRTRNRRSIGVLLPAGSVRRKEVIAQRLTIDQSRDTAELNKRGFLGRNLVSGHPSGDGRSLFCLSGTVLLRRLVGFGMRL